MDDSAARLLRTTALLYAAAIVIHVADHLRRGLDASPKVVLTLGTLAGLAQAVAIASALTRRSFAPLLAVAVAVSDGIGVVAVHLLPRWSFLSDSFAGAERAPGVTALSWVTAIVEIAAGLAFAYAGWVALRREARPPRGEPGLGGTATG